MQLVDRPNSSNTASLVSSRGFLKAGAASVAALIGAPHPAGALRMGADPRTSVVASNHEAHEVPGLFVADPSAFPLPPNVDPSLGIMAWSYVAARAIEASLG